MLNSPSRPWRRALLTRCAWVCWPLLLSACVQPTYIAVTGPVVPVPGIGTPMPPPSPAVSTPDASSAPKPAPPAAQPQPPSPPAIWSQRMDYRRIGLAQFTQGRGIEVDRMADDRLRLRMPNAFAFSNRGTAVSSELRDLLVRLCASIRKDEPVYLTITSHPDTGVSPDASVVLTQERARNVADVLAANGIAASRIQLQSWGPGAPWTVPDRLDIAVRDAGPAP